MIFTSFFPPEALTVSFWQGFNGFLYHSPDTRNSYSSPSGLVFYDNHLGRPSFPGVTVVTSGFSLLYYSNFPPGVNSGELCAFPGVLMILNNQFPEGGLGINNSDFCGCDTPDPLILCSAKRKLESLKTIGRGASALRPL